MHLFFNFFWKNPISEVSNTRQTSKIYSQIAEMLFYKIRDFGKRRTIFSNFFRRSKIISTVRTSKMSLSERVMKWMKIRKKIDFFKTSQFFTPTMINENTQLGKVLSLLKGLECYFHAEDEKSIFYFK